MQISWQAFLVKGFCRFILIIISSISISSSNIEAEKRGILDIKSENIHIHVHFTQFENLYHVSSENDTQKRSNNIFKILKQHKKYKNNLHNEKAVGTRHIPVLNKNETKDEAAPKRTDGDQFRGRWSDNGGK